MLFYPKKSKYKKSHTGKSFNRLNNNISLKKLYTPSIKLISKGNGRLTTKQLVASRAIIRKFTRKVGFVRFNLFPQKSVTKKPSEIRMGKGKGSVSHWVSNVKVGTLICQVYLRAGLKNRVLNLLRKVQIRLPINTKIQ